jgi:dipeptidyl aminopeptidase/acylaminoacyl peptidase
VESTTEQNDARVKLEQSEKITATIHANGGSVTFVVYFDEGHTFARSRTNWIWMA